MILDDVKNLALYETVLPGAAKLAWLLKDPAFSPEDAATHGDFKILHKHYEQRSDENRKFETHDHTVDVMIGLDGAEYVHLTGEDQLQPGEPLPNGGDGMKLIGGPQGTACLLTAGKVLLIFPHEAHMVGGKTAEGPNYIDKLVVKLPFSRDTDCPCTSDCVRHGNCALCVRWHRNPTNSLPYCLREKGKLLIERACAKEKHQP